jgi:hypothetical protein
MYIVFLGLVALPSKAYPYSHTIVIDGVNDFTPGERFTTSTSGYNAYVSWDAQNLYVGSSGAGIGNSKHWLLVYLQCGVGGSHTGVRFNTQEPGLPFAATHLFAWKGDNVTRLLFNYNDSAGWNVISTSAVTAQRPGQFEEAAIQLNSLGNPNTLRMAAFWINETQWQEWSYSAMPSTAFRDGYDPNVTTSLFLDFRSANSPNPVPVPPSVLLLGPGLIGLAALRRKLRK